jgi:hypothetical protein
MGTCDAWQALPDGAEWITSIPPPIRDGVELPSCAKNLTKLSHGFGLKGLDLDILELGTPSRPAGECPCQDYQQRDKAGDKCTEHEWGYIAGRLFVFFNQRRAASPGHCYVKISC